MRRFFALLLVLCLLPAALPGAGAYHDVVPDSWYAPAAAQLTTAGLLTGYPDGTFGPTRAISAAEYVTLVARCAGVSRPAVRGRYWAEDTLLAALAAGWYDYDELPPTGEGWDKPITRALAVKILMRALFPDLRGDYVTESAKIADFSALDGRYYEPVLAAYAAGLIQGDDRGRFDPHGLLTRAQVCVLLVRALARMDGAPAATDPFGPEGPDRPAPATQGSVAENGWLQVKGTQLCGQSGAPIVLRGMSSHGLQWYGAFASSQAMKNTAAFGANVFRLAMYTAEGGYLQSPAALEQQVCTAVDAAIAQGLYVIVDWHILSDGDPMLHVDEAVDFFSRLARRYADVPNLLYEICNEPNGGVTWAQNVKPYAQRVVDAIRAHSKGVILIGSPTWSQDIHQAAADPLVGENLMYTLHFYAGTHGRDLRSRMEQCLSAGLPLFVSEWGVSRADGSGGVFLREAGEWLDFLDAHGISWCNWSLCDKDETSAALRPGTPAFRAWTEEDLTQSGHFVFHRFGGA